MSMGFKPCPHCNAGEAEALYAVDGKIEWYCPECNTSWTEDPAEKAEVIYYQPEWGYNNLGEEVDY